MIKIGIIGAENSHAVHISKTINVNKDIDGCIVTHLWGETDDHAKNTAEKGEIENIVSEQKDMLGEVDALIVDHRDAKYHLDAAKPFIESGIPTFVDKPFCSNVKEGKEFLDLARSKNVPVTSFSILPFQQSFVAIDEQLQKADELFAITTGGPADIHSQWGGIFFYGIHQVDMILRAVGYDVDCVEVHQNGIVNTATIYFKSGALCTMNMVKDDNKSGFYLYAQTSSGLLGGPVPMDENPYLSGIRMFTDMFKTGQTSENDQSMLMPVSVLEALNKSVVTGQKEYVELV